MTSARAPNTDIAVVGGGIVGLSTAVQLQTARPGARIVVLEKEPAVAAHQSGHNSGVIHAGVYYAPGSLKARFCSQGVADTLTFCRAHGLPVEQCGKLIVATNELEVSRLDGLYERCVDNGLSPERLDAEALRRREPNITGRAAIFVAASGIADYPAIVRRMAQLLEQNGGEVRLEREVRAVREEAEAIILETSRETVRARHAVFCGGLMADRLLKMCGVEPDFRVVPFRGEYFRLPASRNAIVRHLIYPVPDPSLPFLGVHLTRMIDGSVTVGPNAVLALAREGYRGRDVSPRDLAEMAAFPGFWRLLGRHAGSAVREASTSLSRARYLDQCRRYCPGLTLADLQPHPAGVRAQAVARDGDLIHDFLIRYGRRSLHVCNAPSPAATSAIPIGRHLAQQFAIAFGDKAA